jgi:hypothetical protein
VVAEDANRQTLDWEYGAVRAEGDHDWQRLQRRIVLPVHCAYIKFRLVGYGKESVWMDRPALTRVGKVQDFVAANVTPVTFKNALMSLTIQADGGLSGTTATGTATGKRWRFTPPPAALRVKALVKNSPNRATLTLYSIESNESTSIDFQLASGSPEVEMKLDRTGPMPDDLFYPGAIETTNQDRLIVPMNEGIQFPADDPATPTMDLVTYGGHGICMPWFGVENTASHAGAMAIYETPDDAYLRLERSEQSLLQPRAVWHPSRHQFRYERRLRLSFLAGGGYVAMAKRYRAYAKQTGLLVSLRQKERANRHVDRLVGAINVWNWDMDPIEIGKEMKSAGMNRVLWSRGGSPADTTFLNNLGFLTSRYDIYQDVYDPKIALSWMNTAGWPEALVELENGEWMKGWAHPDRRPDGSIHWIQGGVISSGAGLARAEQVIPAELKIHPYHCRFIDTTTASPWREDYNPLHPLSRSDDRKNKMALLAFCSQKMGLVVGSETGLDASVPYLEYFEGMESFGPYRLPDSGTDMMAYRKPTPDFTKYQVGSFYRLPLWELVYHDCTVAQWYWGDASNKAPEVWDQRDLLNILYGTGPLVMFDKPRWKVEKNRILQTYNNVCGWTRQVGYDEMLTHAYLTPDHTVQRTTFASGKAATVNFGTKTWKNLAPLSFELQVISNRGATREGALRRGHHLGG